MADQNAGQGQPESTQQRPSLPPLRVEEIQRATFIDNASKAKYAEVFSKLWGFVNSKPPDSTEHKQSWIRLLEFSNKLRNMAAQHRRNQLAQQNNAPQPQQNQPSQPAQQPQQQSQTQQQPSQSTQPSQPGNVAPTQNPANPLQGHPNANARPAQPQASQFPPAVLDHIRRFNFILPPNVAPGTPEAEMRLREMKTQYATHLTKMEQARTTVARLTTQMDALKAAQKEVPAELIQARSQAEQIQMNAKASAEEFRRKQGAIKAHMEQMQANRQAQQNQQNQQGQQNQQSQPPQAQNNQATSGPQVKIEGGTAGPSHSLHQNQHPNAQPTQTAQAQPNATQSQPNIKAPQSPATTGPHSQPVPTSQAPSQNLPGQMHQQPQSAHPQSQQGGMNFNRPQVMPQQGQMGPGQQNSPQTQGASNVPVPLTHQAAVTAARSYSDQRTATPQQTAPPGGFNGGNRETPNNAKMPIPKNLNVSAPTPVNMGPSRPTLGASNGAPGMMGQPVLNKLPGYMLEGDGERVLNKKKLDELVRQVTGGGDNQAGETLTAEVEETMLQLADDFVDNVISTACKLSKLRDSNQLDVRDIQLVLERNYNIRIPGFASDEIRTVRKLHPAPGWNEKMKALQAAKIMGGKTDV